MIIRKPRKGTHKIIVLDTETNKSKSITIYAPEETTESIMEKLIKIVEVE